MALTLTDVCDVDCVVSISPLVVDLPSTERYVTGARAVAYRVLYGWIADARLLELEGSWDPTEIAMLRSLLASIAEEEDFVLGCDVTVDLLAAGDMIIAAALGLIDGRTYLLEVTVGEAVSVIFP
jgi:hypothetical protein